MTNYMPMLCETAERPPAWYINNDDWWAEQKLDGDRILISVQDGEPTAYNRNGDTYRRSIPRAVLEEFRNPAFDGQWVFDGELLNGEYHVFDIRCATLQGTLFDLTDVPYETRRAVLEGVFTRWTPFHVFLVGVATTTHGKQDLFDKVQAASGEGVIFKHREGIYYPGRRSHHMLKFKFVATGDVIVSSVWREGKRSVGIEAYDENNEKVDLGACTMTERNLARVNVGDVIEIKYLYRGAQGHLFQPRFVRLRDDKPAKACFVDQFKTVNKAIIK